MLGKLIKYEFKAFSRKMIPLLIVFCSFSALIWVNAFKWDTWKQMLNADFAYALVTLFVFIVPIYIICFGAILFLSYINCVVRFNKTMFSNEGYLMRTIPVKTSSHLISKLLVAFVWFLISYACFAVMISLLTLSSDQSLVSAFRETFGEMVGDSVSRFIVNFLSALVIFLYIQLLLIAAVTIGNRASDHKTAASVAAAILLNILVAFTTGIANAVVYAILDIDPADASSLLTVSDSSEQSAAVGDYIQAAVKILFIILFFIFTCRTIDKNCDIE